MNSEFRAQTNTVFQNIVKQGWLCFVIPMAAFGIQHFIYAGSGGKAGLGPPWAPAQPVWAYLTGAALLAISVSIAIKRNARVAAILLGVLLFLRVLIVYAPGLAAHIHDPLNWTRGFELLAMCGASLNLAATLRTQQVSNRGPENVLRNIGKLGQFLFCSGLVVFGIQHFLYASFIARIVPSWIPGRLFWAYFVGVAFLAAALSIISRKKAHLAASLLALMFFLWVLVLHLPRVVAAVRNGNEWTQMFVALAMSGSALILAGSQPHVTPGAAVHVR